MWVDYGGWGNGLVGLLTRCLSIWYTVLMAVGKEDTCKAGILTANPGKVADEGHPLLGNGAGDVIMGPRIMLSQGIFTCPVSLEGEGKVEYKTHSTTI
jgi:hypothetical protein